MKTLSLLPAALLGVLAACATNEADTSKTTVRTEITFDHPENFTDVKDSGTPTDKGRDAILGMIRDFMVKRADSLLPDGYNLKIVFTDIDLAGDFEPWRGPQWMDVRIVKAIYPPAFKFSYTVTDPAGAVVKQGTEHIKDMTFETRIMPPNDDALRYEKDILGDWLRNNLRDLKKA